MLFGHFPGPGLERFGLSHYASCHKFHEFKQSERILTEKRKAIREICGYPFLHFLFTLLCRYGNVRSLSKLMVQRTSKTIISIAIISGISSGG
jgi:hypothetical protein